MSERSKTLTATRDTLQRIADEAQRNAIDAENVLGDLEQREARRSARIGNR